MESPDHAQRAHATLSASSCDRWWNCPGSIALIEMLGTTSFTSVYAAEGTAAHELAHLCLLSGQDAIEYIDRIIDGFPVTLEMAEAVQIYLDFCRDLRDSGPHIECFTEKRFTLKSLHPPAPMFGTTDFAAIDKSDRSITIVDFKYGAGVVVSIEDNPQLKYYALGSMLAFPDISFDRVRTVIIQPRAPGSQIKTATYDAIDILGWSVDLIDHAKATMQPDAALHPGQHCRFCPVSGQCKAQAEAALAVAQIEFADVVDPIAIAEGTPMKAPPIVSKLTPNQMAIILNQAEILEDFIKSLRVAAQNLIENGEEIPGWKVVPTRARRSWRDEDGTPFTLDIMGLTTEQVWTRKLISPAQAEKVVMEINRKAGMRAKDAESKAKADLKDLIESKSSGGTLAPVADTRTALPGRGSEFDFEDRLALLDK